MTHAYKSDFFLTPGFAVNVQVDEHQHLTHIFISDILPDGIAYREGLCCLSFTLFSNAYAWL